LIDGMCFWLAIPPHPTIAILNFPIVFSPFICEFYFLTN